MTLKANSQTAVLNKNGDTTICFTINQSKFLLKKCYEVDKYAQLDSICEKQLSFNDSVHNSSEIVFQKQSLIIKNQEEEMGLRKYEIDKLNEQIKVEQKNTRKQKAYKWIAIGAGSISTVFITYKWITK